MSENVKRRLSKLEAVQLNSESREPMTQEEIAQWIYDTRPRLIEKGYLVHTAKGLELAKGVPLDHDRTLALLCLVTEDDPRFQIDQTWGD